MKSGQRVGDWFLWVDIETVETSNSNRRLSIITVRDAVINGDILAEAIVSPSMAKSLRAIASKIEEHCRINGHQPQDSE